MTVNSLDFVDINSVVLCQSADNRSIGAGILTQVQITIVSNGSGGNHSAGAVGKGVVISSCANLDPATNVSQMGPSGALGINKVTVNPEHIIVIFPVLGKFLGQTVTCILGVNLPINLTTGQMVSVHQIIYRFSINISSAVLLPPCYQSVFITVRTQYGDPSYNLAISTIPTQELVAIPSGHNRVIHFFVQVITVGVQPLISVCLQKTYLRHATTVGIVLHITVVGRRGIGINTVDIHVHFNFSAAQIGGIAVAGFLAPQDHCVQQLIGAALVDDHALQIAVAVHPAGTGIVGEHNQSVVLVLLQRQAVGGSEGVDLLIKCHQSLAQSQVCIFLRDGMDVGDGAILIQHGIVRNILTISGIILKMMFFLTDSAVTGAEFAAGIVVALSCASSHLLQNCDCSFADLTGCSGCTHGNQAQQHDQSQ